MKIKKPKLQPKQIFKYEIFPINFVMLSKTNQTQTLSHFQQLLNTLPCETNLLAIKTQKHLEITNRKILTTYYRFFLESKGETLDWLLDQYNFKNQPLTEIPNQQIKTTHPTHLQLENKNIVKSFTIYHLPATLIPGFISEIYGLCERLLIQIKPLPINHANSRIGKYMRLLRSLILADNTKNKIPKEEIQLKHQIAQTTYHGLITGNIRLFELKITLTLATNTKHNLTKQTKHLKETLQARFIKIDSPKYLQKQLYQGTIAKKLTVDTTTASAFFPFVSADLIETPDGVFLGTNRLTGAPVIFDPQLHMNQNIMIIGKSGSGKSFLSKILLTRLTQKHKNISFYIIDPEKEYTILTKNLNASTLNLTANQKHGLDPIAMFQENKETATSLLADITQIKDTQTYQQLRNIINSNNDLIETYQNSPPNIKEKLEPFITGPDNFLTLGKPQIFQPKIIFNLNKLNQQITPTQNPKPTTNAANILLFSKIWQQLDNQNLTPLQTPKIVIIDELYLYLKSQTTANFLETISRRGRKRNIIFILNTQRLNDITQNPTGKAIIENCATKILLRQDETTINQTAKTLKLSIAETQQLTEYTPGQALLLTDHIHLPIQIIATPEEYALFTTKPNERKTQN